MLFNSLSFLIFFPTVVLLYFCLPHRFRWFFLLLASYYFYMCWKAEYVVLIAASTLSGYIAALLMARQPDRAQKKKFLFLGISFNLGLLFIFKYLNFVNDSLRAAMNTLNIFYDVPVFKLLLPVGISFYTFQIVGYLIDVYREEIKPEKHLGIFSVYVAFFPQLVAGPIERASTFLPQFFEKHEFNYRQMKDGLLLMLWGGFKKVVIADRLALLVDHIYKDPTQYTGLPLIIGSVAFAFQVYCDFSGYSDIAIGAGRVMGFRLMKNFDRPYISRSVSEFWRRWHISLSTWIRDYVFLPLVIQKRNWRDWGVIFSSMISFVLVGLWHGANWNFIVFGILHGSAQSYEVLTKKFRIRYFHRIPKKLYSLICLLVTFSFVNITMVFFRANNLADALYVITHMFSGLSFTLPTTALFTGTDYIIALVMLIVLEWIQAAQARINLGAFLASRPRPIRWATYYTVIFMIIIFGVFTKNQFVYFQF